MSYWVRPMVAAKKAVEAPTMVTTILASGANSNIGERRQTMKTPAVTMVAAWISAETGVGPSIASGSQVWSGTWADFPMAPMKSRIQSVVSVSGFQDRKWKLFPTWSGTAANTVENCTEL